MGYITDAHDSGEHSRAVRADCAQSLLRQQVGAQLDPRRRLDRHRAAGRATVRRAGRRCGDLDEPDVRSARRVPGFVTAYPADGTFPLASNLNYVAATPVANAALVKLSAAGTLNTFVNVATHVIIDVNGYFTGTQ